MVIVLQSWRALKFIEHRIADRRVVRLIQKRLKPGGLEEGKRVQSEIGTVQGGSISPLRLCKRPEIFIVGAGDGVFFSAPQAKLVLSRGARADLLHERCIPQHWPMNSNESIWFELRMGKNTYFTVLVWYDNLKWLHRNRSKWSLWPTTVPISLLYRGVRIMAKKSAKARKTQRWA
jgi:hypothetical protein